FIDDNDMQEKEDNVFFNPSGRICVYMGEWGDGHIPPPKNVIVEVLREMSVGGSIRKSLAKARSMIGKVIYKELGEGTMEPLDLLPVSFRSASTMVCFFGISGESPGAGAASDYTFAAYLYVDGERVDKVWYQKNKYVKFDVSGYEGRDIRVVAFYRSGAVTRRVECSDVNCYGVADT